jgi:hypothetical protein
MKCIFPSHLGWGKSKRDSKQIASANAIDVLTETNEDVANYFHAITKESKRAKGKNKKNKKLNQTHLEILKKVKVHEDDENDSDLPI